MMPYKNKLRLSYSKLNSFANYDRQEAIDMILGRSKPTTPEMELGTQAHKFIESNRLDLEKIGEGGIYEEKFSLSLYDWLDFALVIDRRKDNVIVDYKTGSGDPMQLYVYAFCLATKDIKVDEGRLVYIEYNPSTKEIRKKTQSVYPIGAKELNMAWSFMDETSHEIKDVLNNLNFNW